MLQKSLSNENSFFMVLEKMILLLANFVVFACMARFLGPELFGTFSLVQAILLVGMPVGLFASEQVMVKLILDERYSNNKLLKHAILLKACTSLLVYAISIQIAWFVFGYEIALLVAIMCLIHLCNFDVLFLAYERATENSKKIFNIRLSVMLPMALVKVVAVLTYPSLELLFFIFFLEALILAIAAYLNFRKIDEFVGTKKALLDREYFSRLFRSSWPIFSATLLIMLYSRADQFMIKKLLGDVELGHYAAGAKLSEASTLLLTTLIISRFPSLLALKKSDFSRYNDQIVFYLQLSLIAGLALFVGIYFLSDSVLLLAFGEAYLPAHNVLRIHMFGAIFIYFGTICTQWLIAEELEIYRLIRVAVGMQINVILNVIWIPKYGIEGAAAATVVSQFGSNVLFNYVSKKTRPFFYLELSALNLITILANYRR